VSFFNPAKKTKKGCENQRRQHQKKETPEEKDPPLLGIQTLLRQDTFRSAHEYDVEGHDSSWIDLTDGGEIGADERSRNTLLFPLLLFKAAFFEILSRAAQASQAEFSSFLLLGGTIRETQHRYKE
jgi:hypothetical protein|tara:strand:+ start:4117 stop:4494 length:378 start_codon:yes stop_codon:yes gene_type:complete